MDDSSPVTFTGGATSSSSPLTFLSTRTLNEKVDCGSGGSDGVGVGPIGGGGDESSSSSIMVDDAMMVNMNDQEDVTVVSAASASTVPSFASLLISNNSDVSSLGVGTNMGNVDLIEECKELSAGIRVRAGKLNKLVEILIDSFGKSHLTQ